MKFVRLAHRWLAPAFVLTVISVVITGLLRPTTPAQIAQQLVMLLLMLSGMVLFSYPFWARSNKQKKNAVKQSAAVVRKIRRMHYWLAPLFVLALIAVIVTGAPQPTSPAQIAQQLVMFLLMLSGVSLFGYTLWARNRPRKGGSGMIKGEEA